MNHDDLRTRLQRIEEAIEVHGRAAVQRGPNRLVTAMALAAAVLAGVGLTMFALTIVDEAAKAPAGAVSQSVATAPSSAPTSAPSSAPTDNMGCSPGPSQDVPPWWPDQIEPEIVMVKYTTDNPDVDWLEQVTEEWGLEEYSHSSGTGWFRYHITDGNLVLDKVLFLQNQPEVASALPAAMGGGWEIYPTIAPRPSPAATGC